jgi:hypothetical protein
MKVVVAGDFLRPNQDGTFHQAANIRWLRSIVAPSLEKAGISVLDTADDFLGISYDEIFSSFYQSTTGMALLEKWAALFESLPQHPLLLALCERLSDAVTVVFEPSRAICALFQAQRVRYLGVSVHPLRFADDLLLTCSSNDPGICERLRVYGRTMQWQHAQWCAYADKIRVSQCHASGPREGIRPDGEVLIFLAQASYDASLIVDGSFFDLPNSQGRLNGLAQGKALYLKPHPYDPDSALAKQWKGMFPHSQVLDENWYEALAQYRAASYVPVSSGAGYEARLAGRPVTCLSPHAHGPEGAWWNTRYTIGSEIWDTSFWPAVLTGDGMPNQVYASLEPDRLRRLINQWWSKKI